MCPMCLCVKKEKAALIYFTFLNGLIKFLDGKIFNFSIQKFNQSKRNDPQARLLCAS